MEQNLNVDEIWRRLKPWGKYQLIQLSMMWATCIPGSLHLLSVVFTGYRPPHRCADVTPPDTASWNTSNYIVTYGKCSLTFHANSSNETDITKSCYNGYHIETHKDISFVTEWNLFCGDSAKADLAQGMALFGQGLGAFMCAGLSDRFGRKPVHIASHISLFIISIIAAFIPSYVWFSILRFFTGVAVEGLLLASVVQYVETLPEEWRFTAEVTGLVVWTTGVVLLTPLAYLMREYSWRYFQLLLASLSVYSLVEYWMFDESLRWLMANGRLQEAERVVRKAAKLNKMSFEKVIQLVSDNMEASKDLTNKFDDGYAETEKTMTFTDIQRESNKPEMIITQTITKMNYTEVKKYSIFDILKDRTILINSMIIWFTWVTNSLTYYGLTLISSTLYGNRFLNFFLLGSIEYLSAVVEFSLLNRIGRKRTLFTLLGTTGISLLTATLLTTFMSENPIVGVVSTILVIIGKFGVTGAFSSVILFTSELYPTNLRTSGYGMASIFSRIGAVLAPFSSTFIEHVKWGPGITFGCMCLISAILISHLPETLGRELPTTIEELKIEHVKWGPDITFGCMCLISAILISHLPETLGRELPTTIEELKAWYKTHSGLHKS